MPVDYNIKLTEPRLTEVGKRCVVEFTLMEQVSKEGACDRAWIMTTKIFHDPKIHAEDPLWPDKDAYARNEHWRSAVEKLQEEKKDLQNKLDLQRSLVAQLGNELTEKEDGGLDHAHLNRLQRNTEIELLKDLREYYGGQYYIVGDGCPPDFLDKEFETFINAIVKHGSFKNWCNRLVFEDEEDEEGFDGC